MAVISPVSNTTHASSVRGHRISPARQSAVRLVAVGAIWISSLIIVVLWESGGGIGALTESGAAAASSIGRLTGLVAANLMLYQVALMARIPLFEEAFGRDALTRAHRLTGFWSFWLMLVHIVMITAGYADTATMGFWSQLWQMIWTFPGMLLATAGTLCLVAVVVLSIRAARSRMRYESWHLIHLYAYLGVFLALPHQLWTGSDFVTSPIAQVYWQGIWYGTVIAVVFYRVALPILQSRRHRLRVERVETDGVAGVRVDVAGTRLDRLHARAGQFFVWRFHDGPGWMRGHPFSLSAAPERDRIEFTARIVGDGTRRIARMKPGTRVTVEGPYGIMTGDRRTRSKLMMFGAGAGVAPLVGILAAETFRSGEVTLITRDSRSEAALCTSQIASLVAHRGVRHFALDGPRTHAGPPWLPVKYEAWGGAQLIAHLAPDIGNYDFYLCGPTPWMRAIRSDLAELGVANRQIHWEEFSI